MEDHRLRSTENKYRLPYHWMRDPLSRDSILYSGYLRVVLDLLPAEPARVLDAGCGDGVLSWNMSKMGHDVTGVDFLEISVTYARQLVPGVHFFQADLREGLPRFEDEEKRFDYAVLVEVYEHISPEDCPKVLGTLKQVLSEEGRLIISVPSTQLPLSKLHHRHFNLDQLQRELKEAGFGVREIVFQHSLGPFCRLLFHDWLDRILNNRVLQPVILKRLRRFLYLRFFNRTGSAEKAGRYIVVAQRGVYDS